MEHPIEMLNMDSRLILPTASLTDCIRTLESAPDFHVPPGSLNIVFVDEPECRRLHDAFFSDPEITDVMTFPGDHADDHAGDIAICPAVAARFMSESGEPFERELTLYLVHAWLHLAGLEDKTHGGISRMRRAEAQLLALLEENEALLQAAWIG